MWKCEVIVMKCKYCDNYSCRCNGCFALVSKDGEWFCDLEQEFCSSITECDGYEDDTGCD